MSVIVKYMWLQTCLPIWFIESFPQKLRKHSQQSFTNTPCMVWTVFSWTELLQEQELVREQKGKNYARNWEKNQNSSSPLWKSSNAIHQISLQIYGKSLILSRGEVDLWLLQIGKTSLGRWNSAPPSSPAWCRETVPEPANPQPQQTAAVYSN